MASAHEDTHYQPVASEELDEQQVVDLPAREALSLISTDVVVSGDNVAMPINEAVAVNNQSDYSLAIADADQIVNIEQTAADSEPSTSSQEPGSGWGRRGRR